MPTIELRDGRKIEIRGEATPDKVNSLLKRIDQPPEANQVQGQQAPIPEPAPQAQPEPEKKPSGGIIGFGKTLGTAAAVASGATKDIGEATVTEADSRFKLSKLLNDPNTSAVQKQRIRNQLGMAPSIPTAEKQIPELTKTAGQVAGEGLSTLGTAAIGAAAPAGIAGRLALGGTIGAVTGVAGGLAEGQTAPEIAKSAAVGGGAGLVIGGAFEALAPTMRLLAKSNFIRTKVASPIERSMKAPVREITADIEKGYRTFGEKAASIIGKNGQPVYVGRTSVLKKAANNELKQKGSELMTVARQYPKKSLSRSSVTKSVMKEMQDDYGGLSQAEMNKIKFEQGRMPLNLNVEDTIKSKRIYDSKISDSSFLRIGEDSTVGFITDVRYRFRNELRKQADVISGNPRIRQLNDDLGVAMDMRHLASSKLAKKRLDTRVPASLTQWLGQLFNDAVLSPSVATRTSQALRLGQQGGGQQLLRKAATIGAAKQSTESR